MKNKKSESKKIIIFVLFVLMIICLPRFSDSSEHKGIKRVIKNQQGHEVGLYEESHALVIGVSNYTAGWPKLESVPGEIDQVEDILQAKGFQVEKVIDPDSRKLEQAFKIFIDKYGFVENNRLLFFFSGHGHTRKGGKKGYLVPTDAPNPKKNDTGFVKKALPMTTIIAWSRELEAKHALFLFDSCFSGTIFKQKDLPKTPAYISNATALPVRQFISAGSAGETVPARSVFTPAFIDALKYKWGDLNKDGYISGTELGLYLQKIVTDYSGQSPQYGKIKDYELSRGDFIFTASNTLDSAYLEVKCNVSGAKIYLDSDKIGTTDLESTKQSPGQYRLKVEKTGYETYLDNIELKPGSNKSIYVELRIKLKKAKLYIYTDPENATVKINNTGYTFYQGISLDPDSYDIEISANGYQSKTMSITLEQGQEKQLNISLPKIAATRGIYKEPVTGMEFVWVKGGCYQMGCGDWTDNCEDDEKPVHEVCVDGFWMGKYEVTNAQYRKFKSSHDSSKDYEGKTLNNADQPVVLVSWEDAKAYADWLSKKNGFKFRLPTEAEWEYACRAGTSTSRYWGNNPDNACKYGNVHDEKSEDVLNLNELWKKYNWDNHKCNDGYAVTSPVGSFRPNSFGLYDMIGNVWEWCEDWYSSDAYKRHDRNNPVNTTKGSYRVVRGGSWFYTARYCRSAFRHDNSPGLRYSFLGFRLLRTP